MLNSKCIVSLNGNLYRFCHLSTALLDTSRAVSKFAFMHRANILLLSSALGLIGRGLLCMGGGERSE